MLFGDEGQERLKKAHIFIAGAGGLGSPVSLYLAVAGVGTITIVDMDVVDQTNLNRQILHFDRDIGRKKTASAREKLQEINPDITVNAIDVRIDETNAADLVGKADGIVDAMDNYPTRYLLNEVAIAKEIPFFHGGIYGFYGQATTIIPGTTPCLKCIFPKAPAKRSISRGWRDSRNHRHGAGQRSTEVPAWHRRTAHGASLHLGRDAGAC